MYRYREVARIGQGAFGTVFRAEHRETGEVVAIKQLQRRFSTWESCLDLSEVRTLRALRHPHIVRLKEVLLEEGYLSFVFENLSRSLTDHMSLTKRPLAEDHTVHLARQMLSALDYMHKQGYFHRDLKPDNILITSDASVAKIADFGIATEIRKSGAYTPYISTRWYRSPEILLCLGSYGPPVDLWALGCVLSEMLLAAPLLPGKSDTDQLQRTCALLGAPTAADWPEGVAVARKRGIALEQGGVRPRNGAIGALTMRVSVASPLMIHLLSELFIFNPKRRMTAERALEHRVLADKRRVGKANQETFRGDIVRPTKTGDYGSGGGSGGYSHVNSRTEYQKPVKRRARTVDNLLGDLDQLLAATAEYYEEEEEEEEEEAQVPTIDAVDAMIAATSFA